jgi:hemoglobin/transferrin/lactoferrin receptor protein
MPFICDMNNTLLIALFCLSPMLLLAQPDTSMVLQPLAAVEITADRLNTRRKDAPEVIRVMTAEQIRSAQVRTTPEALMQTCGVFVQKTNHGGGSPFVRGLTGHQTLLVLDGIRLNNATFRYGPNQYLNTIDIFTLDQIEVLAGNGSAQYGSDALGGAIVLRSRLPDISTSKKIYGSLQGRIVTQGMERTGRAELGWQNQRFAIESGLTGRRFGHLVGGDTTGRQSPSGYDEWAWNISGQFRVHQRWLLSAAHRRLTQTDVPVYHKVQLERFLINAFQPQTKTITWVKSQWTDRGRFTDINLTLAHQHSDEGRISQKINSNTQRYERDSVRTLSATLQANLGVWVSHPTVVGAELYHDQVQSGRYDLDLMTQNRVHKRGLYPDGATMTQASVYMLQAWHPDKNWTINGGLRGQFYSIRVRDTDNGAVHLHLPALVGSWGVLYRVTPKATVFGSFNTAFRAPNVDDLGTLGIVDFRYEVPNYDLRPERSYNMQVGWRFEGDHVRTETAIYRNELRHLITRIRQGNDSLQGYPVFLKVNSEQGYIQGIEQSLQVRWHQNWVLHGSVAYAYGQNISRREPLRRIPPLFGRAALVYERASWSVTTEVLVAGAQTRLAAGDLSDNRIPQGGTPGWAVLNLQAQWSYGPIRIGIVAHNLTNRDYRYHGSGINGIGRSISMDAQYAFGR